MGLSLSQELDAIVDHAINRVDIDFGETVPLEVPLEWRRFCGVCNFEQNFVSYRTCKIGFIACCSGCEVERIVANFARTNSEVR